MKTYYYLNFPNKRRIFSITEREERPPIHTFIHFPTDHPEVEGYLTAFVTDTTEYLGRKPIDDYWVVDLTPNFTIGVEAFLQDQASVGRFLWEGIREDSV